MVRTGSAALGALFFAATALVTQTSTAQTGKTSATTSSPVAYLYFSVYSPGHNSLTPGQGRTQIEAYSVASDGTLTKIAGSPFAVNGYSTQLCANGRYLFASTHIEVGNNQYPGKMNSYRIESGGALTLSHIMGNANLTNITLDHSGETLYGQKDGLPDELSYNVRWSDGGLEYLGQVTAPDLQYRQAWVDLPVTFTADDTYAYGTTVDAYRRDAGHKLVHSWTESSLQPLPFVGFAVAADPWNNLAGVGLAGEGEAQFIGLASFQVGADGSLTTAATPSSVTRVNLPAYDTISMSPSGKFVAVSGPGSVQIFHWNAAADPTPFAQLPIAYYPGVPNQVGGVPGDAVILGWDNANHLFAYEEGFTPAPSGANGYLYVWTVTDDGVTSAPGSPHQFSNPISTVVEGPGMAILALTAQAQ